MLVGPQAPSEYRDLPPAGVEAIMRNLPGLANFILVDLPACAGEAGCAAARACHAIGIVLEPDGPSVQAAPCRARSAALPGYGHQQRRYDCRQPQRSDQLFDERATSAHS